MNKSSGFAIYGMPGLTSWNWKAPLSCFCVSFVTTHSSVIGTDLQPGLLTWVHKSCCSCLQCLTSLPTMSPKLLFHSLPQLLKYLSSGNSSCIPPTESSSQDCWEGRACWASGLLGGAGLPQPKGSLQLEPLWH